MKIRKATLDDAQEISKLRQETLEKVNIKEYTKEQIKALVNKNNIEKIKEKIGKREVFVGAEEDKIIGCVSFHVSDNKNIISGLYVRHDMQGKGIGEQLMKFIENHAVDRSVKNLILYSTINAEKFYKKIGYEVIKKSPGKVGDVDFIVIEMGKELNKG